MEYIRELIFICGYATLTFIMAFVLAKPLIRALIHFKIGKTLREYATDGKKAEIFNQLHKNKTGTPTMGGLLIWGSVVLVVLISRLLAVFGLGYYDYDPASAPEVRSLLQRSETWLPLFTLIVTALLGAVDDWFNIKGIGKSKGINVKPKFILLTILALLGALWFYYKLDFATRPLHIPGLQFLFPFLPTSDIFLGLWYIPLFILVIISTAHSVNITDGLDGLAGGLLAIAFAGYTIICFATGKVFLAAFCACIVGALGAFLWFNVSPAKFFMGDTGAISLGATLGVIAMLTNTVVVLPIIGFIFVIEALSSAIQLTSKKLRGKKVFLVAPIHHHFEALGWPEHNVVMRFWIIGTVTTVVGVIIALIGRGVY